jgi:HSP20 family protein
MKTTLQKNDKQGVAASVEYLVPEVDIYETKEGYGLEAEMPGVSKDGLEVTLEGNQITILGHRRQEAAPGRAVFSESRAADFRRVFELDPAIDTGRISARMEQGVLKMTLPKSEEVKPRRIQVQ